MANVRKKNGKNGTSYYIRVSQGYDINGKQITKTFTWKVPKGMTAAQERKELQRQIVSFEEKCKEHEIGGDVRFKDFAEEWFKEYANTQLKESSRMQYVYVAEDVYQKIGHLRLNQITTRHVQNFINEIQEERRNKYTGEKLSTRRIKYYLTFISAVLHYAERQGLINQNPCKNVILPKSDKKEKNIYTLEEARNFMSELNAKAPLKYRAFFTLAIFGGFRTGELLGLEWKDVDFQNNVIEIRRVSNYISGKGIYTDTPKTKQSERSLHLPEQVFTILQAYKLEQDGEKKTVNDQWVETDRIFTQVDGNPMCNTAARNWLRRFCKNNSLPYYGVHSFRHLNATLLIESGADIKTVSSALGHAQVSTTLNIYTHAVARTQARASEVLGDLLNQSIQAK